MKLHRHMSKETPIRWVRHYKSRNSAEIAMKPEISINLQAQMLQMLQMHQNKSSPLSICPKMCCCVLCVQRIFYSWCCCFCWWDYVCLYVVWKVQNGKERQKHTWYGPGIFGGKTQFNERRMIRVKQAVAKRVFCMQIKYFIINWNEGVESLVAVVVCIFSSSVLFTFLFCFWPSTFYGWCQWETFEVNGGDYLFIRLIFIHISTNFVLFTSIMRIHM